MLPDHTFDQATAVVTGAGSGLGEAIATTLVRLGAHVALVGRRQDALERVQDALRGETGSASVHVADVRDRARVDEVLTEIEAQHGTVKHLVNNAAGNFRARPEDLSENAWRAVVDIVLHGSWNWTQAVGQRLLATGAPGSIVSIGTVGAIAGGPATVHSASAKAGVLAMTRSLASAWGPAGIRLNVVTPGPINDTGGTKILVESPEHHEGVRAAVPLGRFGERSDITNAVTYLLSDYSQYITGANLFVTGGNHLQAPPYSAPTAGAR